MSLEDIRKLFEKLELFPTLDSISILLPNTDDKSITSVFNSVDTPLSFPLFNITTDAIITTTTITATIASINLLLTFSFLPLLLVLLIISSLLALFSDLIISQTIF